MSFSFFFVLQTTSGNIFPPASLDFYISSFPTFPSTMWHLEGSYYSRLSQFFTHTARRYCATTFLASASDFRNVPRVIALLAVSQWLFGRDVDSKLFPAVRGAVRFLNSATEKSHSSTSWLYRVR